MKWNSFFCFFAFEQELLHTREKAWLLAVKFVICDLCELVGSVTRMAVVTADRSDNGSHNNQ